MADTVREEGYYYGVLDLYYAKMTSPDTAAAAPVYDAPKLLAKTIDVTITPAYREGKLYASNALVRQSKKIDSYTIKCTLDKIPSAVQEEILGRQKDENGVQLITGANQPPRVALGFAVTLDDGNKELWWLYKGTFAEIAPTFKTDNERLEYQTPSLEGTFVRRMDNDTLAAVVETGTDGVAATVEQNWFKAVYPQTATA